METNPAPKSNQELLLMSAYECRGRFIQLTTEMEVMIDKYIAEYFIEGEDKQMEFINLIIGSNIGLKAKNLILEYILHQKIENRPEDIKILIQHIDTIINQRNVFAHWPVNVSKESEDLFINEHKLTFVKLNRGKHEGKPQLGFQQVISESQMTELIRKVNEVNKILSTQIDLFDKAKD